MAICCARAELFAVVSQRQPMALRELIKPHRQQIFWLNTCRLQNYIYQEEDWANAPVIQFNTETSSPSGFRSFGHQNNIVSLPAIIAWVRTTPAAPKFVRNSITLSSNQLQHPTVFIDEFYCLSNVIMKLIEMTTFVGKGRCISLALNHGLA
jgi:hypothetical protein